MQNQQRLNSISICCYHVTITEGYSLIDGHHPVELLPLALMKTTCTAAYLYTTLVLC
jgi:hypothetical protein